MSNVEDPKSEKTNECILRKNPDRLTNRLTDVGEELIAPIPSGASDHSISPKTTLRHPGHRG